MRNVGFNKSDKERWNSGNIAGLVLAAKLTHTTDNTAFTGQPILWDQVNVQMVLKRKGQTYVIFDDAVLPLALDSNFYSGSFEQITAVGTVALPKLRAAAAATKEILLMTAKIRLHDVINLCDGDELTVEVVVTSSAGGTGVDQAVSEILWDVEEGIGNGISIPQIKAETIRANESNTPVAIGDQVVSVRFINNDKAGILTANQVLQSVILMSDKINRTDTNDELMAKRDSMFVSQAESAKRNQCFSVIDVAGEKYTSEDVRLSRCSLRLQLVAANVNSGKNWVVSRRYMNDAETAQKAVERAKKHQVANYSQYV